MSKRTVTIVVTIDDPEKSMWIWEDHARPNPKAGWTITAIAEGDRIRNNVCSECLEHFANDDAFERDMIEGNFVDDEPYYSHFDDDD